ncbi:MAG TPA: DUF2141 domain-containing protein [Polyangiales bacterium]|nr:DUF2141 domain-containing protein [Polyangiales bacterium]
MRYIAFSLALVCASLVRAQPKAAGQVIVDIVGLHSDKGRVLVALYCGEAGFPGEIKKACASQVAYSKDRRVHLVFDKIPAGEFAVSMFHDENANSNLDRNFLGMPKEGWGTSRDAKASFGPPKYSDARVSLRAGERKQVVVHVQY